MPSHAARVLCIGTAAVEIALIAVKRLADRNRAARVIGAGLTACQRPRHVDGLPVAQNVLTVRWLQIVCQPDSLDPVCTFSDATYGPRAAADVAPIAQLHAGRDRRVIRLAAYLQATAGGRGFEFAGARLRHLTRGSVSHAMSQRAENISMDYHGPLWKKLRCANLFLLSRKVHRAPSKC